MRESATVYVKADADKQSIVTVAASERAVAYSAIDYGSSSAGMLGLFGVARASRGNPAFDGLGGQPVVIREGEISDVAFYGNLFSTIDEKLGN